MRVPFIWSGMRIALTVSETIHVVLSHVYLICQPARMTGRLDRYMMMMTMLILANNTMT